jgi:hypothetical protein
VNEEKFKLKPYHIKRWSGPHFHKETSKPQFFNNATVFNKDRHTAKVKIQTIMEQFQHGLKYYPLG